MIVEEAPPFWIQWNKEGTLSVSLSFLTSAHCLRCCLNSFSSSLPSPFFLLSDAHNFGRCLPFAALFAVVCCLSSSANRLRLLLCAGSAVRLSHVAMTLPATGVRIVVEGFKPESFTLAAANFSLGNGARLVFVP